MAWNAVEIEPILAEASLTNNMPALRAYLKTNGIWIAERLAFFETLIIMLTLPLMLAKVVYLYKNQVTQKHNKYDEAARNLRGSLTPLNNISSVWNGYIIGP